MFMITAIAAAVIAVLWLLVLHGPAPALAPG
jgi:hypothetical protein